MLGVLTLSFLSCALAGTLPIDAIAELDSSLVLHQVHYPNEVCGHLILKFASRPTLPDQLNRFDRRANETLILINVSIILAPLLLVARGSRREDSLRRMGESGREAQVVLQSFQSACWLATRRSLRHRGILLVQFLALLTLFQCDGK